jgi:hypothetical protein
MASLIRKPLTWMVLAEIVVVVALVLVAWNVVAGASRRPAPAPSQAQPADVADNASPSPDIPQLNTPAQTAPLPGLNLDSAFWRQRLDDMNRDQVFFEQLEWRVVHSAVDAMQRYLETVVVPAVRSAEHARG